MSNDLLPSPQVLSFLRERDNFLILTHDRPDGDTVGAGYGLVWLLRSMGKHAGLFPNPNAGPKLKPYFSDAVADFSVENVTVISIDVADLPLLFPEAEPYKDRISLVIDHHKNNRINADLYYVDADAPAACELVYRLSAALALPLPQKSAQGIYLGLLTDTGCFKYAGVTPSTLIAASMALKAGAEGSSLARQWFIKKSPRRMKLEAVFIESLCYFANSRICLGKITRAFIESQGILEEEINGMASLTIVPEGCEIGILLKETTDGKVKVSVRTDLYADAAALCSQFGGGGHFHAAGCTLNTSLDCAEKLILQEAEKLL